MADIHKIRNIELNKEFILLQIDGKDYKISLEMASIKLKSANDLQRNFFKISPSGYGIHWPLLDEDLSVDSLLKLT